HNALKSSQIVSNNLYEINWIHTKIFQSSRFTYVAQLPFICMKNSIPALKKMDSKWVASYKNQYTNYWNTIEGNYMK
ncbi:MAG: hypothetical protein ABUL44_00135, partial [Flavobacterium sp.]